jgi:exonuclease III
MKVISWNVIGINGPGKKIMLQINLLQDKTTMLMIQETKSNSDNLKIIMSHLWKNSESISVDVVDASGGLAITWNPKEITLNDLTTTRNSFSSFHLLGTDVHILVTTVYGPQYSDQKANIMDFLD